MSLMNLFCFFSIAHTQTFFVLAAGLDRVRRIFKLIRLHNLHLAHYFTLKSYRINLFMTLSILE